MNPSWLMRDRSTAGDDDRTLAVLAREVKAVLETSVSVLPPVRTSSDAMSGAPFLKPGSANDTCFVADDCAACCSATDGPCVWMNMLGWQLVIGTNGCVNGMVIARLAEG